MSTIPDDPTGFHADVDEAEYHAHQGSLSVSGAKLILKAPALFRHRQLNPEPYRKVFSFGTAAHALVLGRGMESIYVAPFDDWIKRKGPEGGCQYTTTERDIAHADGLSPILPKDWEVVCDMADKLSEHTKAMELLSVGEPEVSAWAVDDETGVLMRCRYDWRRPLIGVDYKQTSIEGGADPDAFVVAAYKNGYHLQQDWYCHVAEILGDPLQGFGFIVQEAVPPYLVTVVELPDELIDLAAERNRMARQMYRDCTESGLWPGYLPNDQIARPEAPAWALRKDRA